MTQIVPDSASLIAELRSDLLAEQSRRLILEAKFDLLAQIVWTLRGSQHRLADSMREVEREAGMALPARQKAAGESSPPPSPRPRHLSVVR